MKSIVAVNCNIPVVESYLPYLSEDSLRDYDIAIFDPQLPYMERIDFSGGGSCVSIDGTSALQKAMLHWRDEINNAVRAGKTVFVRLNRFLQDSGAIGSTTSSRNNRTYSTTLFNNYQSLPIALDLQNVKGKRISVLDPIFKSLDDVIKGFSEYRVIVKSSISQVSHATTDKAVLGGVIRLKEQPGAIVLLPYFDFDDDQFIEHDKSGEAFWSDEAFRLGNAFVEQLVLIDKTLRAAKEETPPPQWVEEVARPKAILSIDRKISEYDATIAQLRDERARQVAVKDDLLGFDALLYGTGKPLETAIEKSLRLLGYDVQNLRIGDLEIDHIIISPEGRRFIGESEGKDSSAVDISKFRQLESNINEDFQREEITDPASGILFGNGMRLKPPKQRQEQFTEKCLKNAKRLGSILIRTADLYPVIAYLLDSAEDEAYKTDCRLAIENAAGGIVQFPTPKNV